MDRIKRFLNWLDDHTLVMCVRCGVWMLKKDAYGALHRVNGRVELCSRCYKELYFPYEEVK